MLEPAMKFALLVGLVMLIVGGINGAAEYE
jgi:hypothetical protein